jgi:Asp-tRNA(Asn)/Glu-tRNA(Gln) amidotransferase A subunit family amidase
VAARTDVTAPWQWTAAELAAAFRSGKTTPSAHLALLQKRIAALNPRLNAIIAFARDADARASKSTGLIQSGKARSALEGIPVLVKDNILAKGMPCVWGSRVFRDYVPAEDELPVARLRAAGAIVLGKTNVPELTFEGITWNPVFGATRNPYDLDLTPGGSSGGSVAAVAAGLVPLALGTDGGGSIRIPSSFCGLFGIKAQFGRVPVFPAAATPTLAHVGPMARTVRDAALLLTAVSGFDARDPASVAAEVPDFLGACEQSPQRLRIAWSPTLGYARPTAEVVEIAGKAARVFEALGCTVELVEKVFDDPRDLWMAEFYAGVGTKLKKPLTEHRDVIDPAVAAVLENALDQTIEEYYRRVFARYEFREQVRRFFERFDLLVTPTLPTPAFDLGRDLPIEFDGENIVAWVAYTYPANLCGLPAASVPCGFTRDGLPVGLQIVSKALRETDILCAAAAFEAAQPWSNRKPPLALPAQQVKRRSRSDVPEATA